jgi:hypothetical protein
VRNEKKIEEARQAARLFFCPLYCESRGKENLNRRGRGGLTEGAEKSIRRNERNEEHYQRTPKSF